MTNNKLLLDEYPLLILPRFAVLIGLNEAIILQQIHYWLLKSGKEIENEKWVYNTFEEWHKQFPFFSISTIKRIFKKLKTRDLIKIKNHAENKHDRTNYYTINYKAIEILEKSSIASCQSDTINSSKLASSSLYTETTSETTTDFPKNGKSDFNNLNDFSVKEEEKERKNSAKKKGTIYPFNDQDFLDAWNLWKQYKKEQFRFTYKGTISEQTALKQLADKSDNDKSVAISIIQASMANGYMGLFRPNKNENQKDRSNSVSTDAELSAALDRRYGRSEQSVFDSTDN